MTENDLYEQIAQYMNLQHKGVLYHFDLAGVNNPSHKSRNLYGRLNGRAWPDLFITDGRTVKFGERGSGHQKVEGHIAYKGLFLELKKHGVRIWLKDGSLSKDAHVQEQAAMLQRLREKGYKAEFAVGFEQAKKIIDDYLV